jgi:hypothetical protein
MHRGQQFNPTMAVATADACCLGNAATTLAGADENRTWRIRDTVVDPELETAVAGDAVKVIVIWLLAAPIE